MKKILGKSLLIISLILSISVNALAGDSISLTMSCTIPAIPGLNAPLIEKETIKTQQPLGSPVQQQIMPEQTQTETPVLIEEDNQSTKEDPAEAGQIVMVKTFYSR